MRVYLSYSDLLETLNPTVRNDKLKDVNRDMIVPETSLCVKVIRTSLLDTINGRQG